MSTLHKTITSELVLKKNIDDAMFLQRFFKTGPGEYGEGDLFLGLRVPQVRAVAKEYYKIAALTDIDILLQNKWHEVRLCGAIILTLQYPKANTNDKVAIYELYISHIGRGINNWDLVDVTCPRIVGAHLYTKDRTRLYDLAKGGLWQKRVSIISTFYFLREGDIIDTLQLAEILVSEKHDLLQKAVGWALREMGKVDDTVLYSFLDKHASTMPRTMLRYSLEKIPTYKKEFYMALGK
jgi:3-methyladenine DNA glycosylase AlkD